MNPDRKNWNQQQQALRQNLASGEDRPKAIGLFLSQHAMVHAAEMSHAGLWSFEDEILDGLSERQIRSTPNNFEHSIVWVIWHLTRIEDATMNLLVAGSPQVLLHEDWLGRLEIDQRDTGNAMDAASVADLSIVIKIQALRAYRLSVGRRTRVIARNLHPDDLKRKVDPDRLRQMTVERAVPEAAHGLLEYWGGLTIAGLLLMPPTRHAFIHWNEALKIKQKIR